MSDLIWPKLGWHVNRGEIDAAVRKLHAATEEQRLAAAAGLEAYVKSLPRDQWWQQTERMGAVVVAAVGCLPSPARVVTMLGRSGISGTMLWVPTEPVVAVARLRGEPWLAELAHRLAGQKREDAVVAASELIMALAVASGAAPPDTDAFVRGWVRQHLWAPQVRPDGPNVTVLDRLRADPLLIALVPRLFEVDGLGTSLAEEGWDGERNRTPAPFPPALATLAEEGRLDRTMLLDGCVGRLLRGDRPGALRAFVALLDRLAPTVDEAAARVLDLVRLLPDAPSTVATQAQRLLRQVDDAGRLELDTLLKMSEQVLTRTEKGLVTTQLRWLAAVKRRVPERSGEIAGVVSAVCDHPAADIQALAVKIAGEQAVVPTPSVVEVFVPPPVEAMPAPISSAGELAEEVVALMAAPPSMPAWERVLAGLVALRATDPDGVTAALTPVLGRLEATSRDESYLRHIELADLNGALRKAIRTAVGGAGEAWWQRLVAAVRDVTGGAALTGIPGPQQVLVLRVGEVCARLRHRPVPNLVATPTSVNGHLDAGVLVDRLAAAERDGWQPWRFDLEQALLRLPHEVDADVLARARELRSEAGIQLANWLVGGGMPDPVATRVEQRGASETWLPEWRAVVALAPAGSPEALARVLCTLTPGRSVGSGSLGWPTLAETLWPAVLPGHRDVIAAWALPAVAAGADQDTRGMGEVLPLLAECTGTVGPAMTLALAYGLAARHTADRVAAVDAVLALGNALDPALLGWEIGALTADGAVKLGRVTGALTDVSRGGAPIAACATVLAALPAVLSATPPPRGTPDLLALASETVAATGWRGRVPQVGALAGRSGKSRLHVEARRLARLFG